MMMVVKQPGVDIALAQSSLNGGQDPWANNYSNNDRGFERIVDGERRGFNPASSRAFVKDPAQTGKKGHEFSREIPFDSAQGRLSPG